MHLEEALVELLGDLVTAKTESGGLQPQQVRQALSHWFTERGVSIMSFKEENNPQNDQHDDYVVVYEATFEPSRLDQARAELWLTTDGRVAIGIETRKRVSERLAVNNRRDGFAAGHEPHSMSETALLTILEVIANGEIAISATVVPLLGLTSTAALVMPHSVERLRSGGYHSLEWLKVEKRGQLSSQALRYHAWT